MHLNRRDLLAKCIALGVVTTTSNLAPSVLAESWLRSENPLKTPTPENELGPFYKRNAPHTAMLRGTNDPGMPLAVAGQVFNTRGDRLEDAKIEIWQTDHMGHYDLKGYRYRAVLVTGSDAKYAFSSVMPGHYPARVCQHIHFAVTAPGCKPLVTQLYFATDPVFDGDPDKNYMRDPLVRSRELVCPVMLKGDPGAVVANVSFELVLERL